MGSVRVLQSVPEPVFPQVIRTVRANVQEELVNSPIGWSVNDSGYIIGRHLSDHYQDPSLAFPALQGPQCRTTLIKGDDGFWYILEMGEPLRLLVQLDAPFHNLEGDRSVITIVTEEFMGFRFEGEGPVHDQVAMQDDPGEEVLVAPEDVAGVDIPGAEVAEQGHEVGEAQVIVRPARDDEVIVNGVTLTCNDTLANFCVRLAVLMGFQLQVERQSVLGESCNTRKT